MLIVAMYAHPGQRGITSICSGRTATFNRTAGETCWQNETYFTTTTTLRIVKTVWLLLLIGQHTIFKHIQANIGTCVWKKWPTLKKRLQKKTLFKTLTTSMSLIFVCVCVCICVNGRRRVDGYCFAFTMIARGANSKHNRNNFIRNGSCGCGNKCAYTYMHFYVYEWVVCTYII